MRSMRLLIEIDSDGRHCSVLRDGTTIRCRRMRTLRFGAVYVCGLFGTELRDDDGVLSGPGLLVRCEECKMSVSSRS